MTIAELLDKFKDHPLMQVQASDLTCLRLDKWGELKIQVSPEALGMYAGENSIETSSENGYTYWDCEVDGVELTACKANPPVSAVILNAQ